MKKQLLLLTLFAILQQQSLAQQPTPEHTKALLSARQGSIVLLPDFLSGKIPSLPYNKMVLPGPQYLISDDPEYIRTPEAVALREQVQPGAVRLYLYNVNGVKEPQRLDRKITAVLKNTGAVDLHLRMLKVSSQPATTNYFLAGKKGLADYFAAKPETRLTTVKPGAYISLDPRLEKQIVKYDELVHGIYEFVIDGTAEISVVQTDPKTPGAVAAARIKEPASSRHTNAGRGVFGVSNYEVTLLDTLNTAAGAVQLIVADGKTDPWVLGKDAATGRQATLAGNYGVMYSVQLHWKSTGGKGLALLTYNARAGDGKWCGGMAAAMVVSGGKFGEGIVQLPSDALRTKGAPEAVLIQVFPPAKEGEVQTINLVYSPPGASCLPTPLIFVPVDMQ